MPEYKKSPGAKSECIGPACGGCGSSNCYGHGGRVKRHSPPSSDEAGVHEPIGKFRHGASGGTSVAGEHLRMGNTHGAKHMHKANLEDLKQMNTKKPELYAEGGSVDSWTKREDNERGVHGDLGKSHPNMGSSTAGHHVRHAQEHPEDREDSFGAAKLHHKKNLKEMRGMKKPNLYAEGGEVEGPAAPGEDESMDDDLKHAMGGEFMSALERKDRKGIMSALEAIILSSRGKE